MEKKADTAIDTHEDAARWRFGDCVLDERTREFFLRGEAVELARKPFDLLAFFVRNPGEVVTKDELFEAIWPGRIVSETALTNAIGRLRTALEDDAQRLIKSVYGYGYRFLGEVMLERGGHQTPVVPSALFSFAGGDPVPFREGWRLHHRLGAGGGGEVWLAERADTSETGVFKFAHDRSKLTALKREITLSKFMRESLGEREDVVRVLDWSLDEPPFFIRMDYCNEGSLADWAVRQGDLKQTPLAQRLELIARAAEALASAHTIGVLHKDLKPSNLLLHRGDGEQALPTLRLSDFGVARLVDRDRLQALAITQLGFTQTLTEITSGTPLYLAPELLAGAPATTRTDIYALGLMLYQLVIGNLRQPLATGWERDVEDPLLAEDIALCVQGDPARRLADAAQLATRLRTLDARRDARQQSEERGRTRTAMQRRFRFAIASALVLGIGIAGYGLWQKRRAELRFELARVDIQRANVFNDFVALAFRSASTDAGSGGTSFKQALQTNANLLFAQYADQPAALADIVRRLSDLLLVADDTEAAAPLLQKFIDTAGPATDAGDLASIKNAMANVEIRRGDMPHAAALLNEARRLVATLPPDDRSQPFEFNVTQALIQRGSGDIDGAIVTLRTALATTVDQPDQSKRRQAILQNLAAALTAANRLAEALAVFESGWHEFQMEGQDRSPDALTFLTSWAVLATNRGLMTEAEARYRQTIDLRRILYGESAQLASALLGLGRVLALMDRVDEALPYIEEARAMAARTAGPKSLVVVSALLFAADAELMRGHLDDAEKWLAQGRETAAGQYGPEHLLSARLGESEGRLLVARHRHAEAKRKFDDAEAVFRKGGAPMQAFLAQTLLSRGWLSIEVHEAAAAIPMLQEALQLREKLTAPGTWPQAEARAALGAALRGAGQNALGAPLWEQGLAELRVQLGNAHPLTLRAASPG